ncbi:hypothetical protein I3F58_16730 [Streptomyces sp. MUM 203J]|uniref:hypothetical protein n=1 Tax=Streptomyces sp. MUM 203J TaxID=2791990 RepID=UPI001F045C1F|nr:hypothetical protein [Streptomyces sp. MUM 203J]MCH0541181.1 hypothetical protein [Streptomyces sp. MUM 203J]
MADGFVRWYRESGDVSVFGEQAGLFRRYGIVLEHPVAGAALVLNVEGDDVPMEQEELRRLLGLRLASITMNWWFSADTNVIGSFTHEPFGCEVQTLWLDGLSPEEAGTVEAAVTAAAAGLPTPSRAVIVDRRGIHDPEDWDSIVLHEGDGFPGVPDCVIAGEAVTRKLLAAEPGLGEEDLGGGLVRLTR